MEKSIGKITNCDTKAELSFSLAPVEFQVEESSDLRVEPCLGRELPVVSYHGGAGRSLSTSLIFDRDADEALDLSKVQSFLQGLVKVKAESQSIPVLHFQMGSFSFHGFLSRIVSTYARFSTNGEAGQIKVELALLASEEDENV